MEGRFITEKLRHMNSCVGVLQNEAKETKNRCPLARFPASEILEEMCKMGDKFFASFCSIHMR